MNPEDDAGQSKEDRFNNALLEERGYLNMYEFARNIVVSDADSTARNNSDSQRDPRPRQDVPPEIPDYEVLKQLGRGAMGTVWKVKQTNPVERELAIKIVGPDQLSGDLKQRLEVERQALAIMEHPGIARMVDAGSTRFGQPWFAMELFEGRRLNKFCDEESLDIVSRLELFAKICDAVQHAHQKGVIHRDLKPSNILARMIDGVPTAKVIDFGLAKATDNLVSWSVDETVHGQILGTVLYMSPEQARSDTPAIDMRTDIYSLGAVLYQLLCGKTPFSEEIPRETPIHEAVNSILNVDPKRPSDRLEANDATERQTNLSSLRAVLTGDLDWVVMKAIEKRS